MRIGVPLVANTDPVALGFLERLAGLASAELALAGDPRHLDVVRLAVEAGPVRLFGGARVQPDALLREDQAVDVLVLLGPADMEATSGRDEEAVIAYLRRARGDVQHVLALGEGVRWAMEAGLSTGRRVVVNQLAPATRARFDATLPAHTDPARDGDLWTASDPPRFLLLLLEFFADLGGFRLPDRLRMRAPWLNAMINAFAPASQDPEDDEGGIPAVQDVEP